MRNRIKILLCVFLVALAGVVTSFYALAGIPLFSLKNNLTFDVIGGMAQSDNYIAVLDRSNMRILLMDKNLKIQRIYTSGITSFGNAENITVDNSGNVYVINTVYDENKTVRKELLKFDKSFGKTEILSTDCRETNHMFYSLTYSPETDTVSYFTVSPEDGHTTVNSCTISAESGQMTQIRTCTMPEDFYGYMFDISSLNDNCFAYTAKNGEIHSVAFEGGKDKIIFSGSDAKYVPLNLANDEYNDNGLYFFDSKSKSVKHLANGSVRTCAPKTVITEPTLGNNIGSSSYFDFYVYKDNIITACDNVLLIFSHGENILKTHTAGLSGIYIALRYLFWICSLTAVCAMCIFLRYLFKVKKIYTYFGKFGKQVCALITGVIVCTVLFSAATTGIYINFFRDMQNNTLLNSSNIISDSYKGEDFDKLQSVKDYQSPSYNKLYDDAFRQINNYTGEWIEDFYLGFTAVRDDDMTLMFYSNSPFSFFSTLAWEMNSPYFDIYEKSAQTHTAAYQHIQDPNAEWIYAVAPITRADNSVAAYTEFGVSASLLKDNISNIFYNETFTLIGLVIVLIIFSAKLIFSFNILLQKNKNSELYRKYKLPYNRPVIRLPLFCIYMLVGVPLFSFPAVLGKIAENTPYLGLPYTFLIFGVIEAFLIFSGISGKIGVKNMLALGCLSIGGGFILSTFYTGLAIFFVSAFLIGFGAGLTAVATHDFIAVIKNPDNDISYDIVRFNADMFMGLVCGLVLGIMTYYSFGIEKTAFAAAVCSLLVILLISYMIPNIKREDNIEYSVNVIRKPIMSGKLLSFTFWVIFPRTLSIFFVFSFMPMYLTAGRGYPITLMGLIALLFCFAIVYISPALKRFIKGRFNITNYAMFSLILIFSAFLIFTLWDNVFVAAVSAIILGFGIGISADGNILLVNDILFKDRNSAKTAVCIYRILWLWCAALSPILYSAVFLYNSKKCLLIMTLFFGICAAVFGFYSRMAEKAKK